MDKGNNRGSNKGNKKTQIVSTALILTLLSQPTTTYGIRSNSWGKDENRGTGSFVIKDGMPHKRPKEKPKHMGGEALSNLLNKFDSEAAMGISDLFGNQIVNTDGEMDSRMNADFYSRGGLRSIPPKYKNNYQLIDAQLKARMSKSGITMQMLQTQGRFSAFRQIQNRPLATSFDITSPGHFLTAEQWKSYIKAHLANNKDKQQVRSYRVGNTTQQKKAVDAMCELVDAVYQATYDMNKKGKSINPDFLVALSCNETGWGTGKYARNNSWFSVNATNSNPDGATKYATQYDSVVAVIELLSNNYTQEGQKYFFDTKGPSMVGANTLYAKEDGLDFPNYQWSASNSSIMMKAFDHYNLKIPNF